MNAWKLEKRIDKMAAEHLLTPALKDWAHGLRLEGNDAIHERENVSKEEARSMQELTRYVLMYLYTLPENVRLASGSKDISDE